MGNRRNLRRKVGRMRGSTSHKLGLPTTALFQKRFCDHVVVSLSHKQQTKSHNIYFFQKGKSATITAASRLKFMPYAFSPNMYLQKPIQEQPNTQNYTVAAVKNKTKKAESEFCQQHTFLNFNNFDTGCK